jgi:predicted dehydrogenase
MPYYMQVSRRQFLKKSSMAMTGALGIPYIVPSSVLGKDGNVAPSNRITMGCIGVGGQGTGNMNNFLSIPEVRIIAVCDVQRTQQEKARQIVDKHYGNSDCAIYTDFRKVIDREDIDTVMIATQDHWHALIAVAAAKAGKDMYCEKPLGVCAAESKAIHDAVLRYSRVFQMGTWQRSDRKFRFACELARNGYLGKVHTVRVGTPGPAYKRTYMKPPVEEPIPPGIDYDMYIGPAPMKPYNGGRLAWPDWYLIWDYCAGFIVNWGVHHLDIANWGCPDVATQPCELDFSGSYRNDGLTDNIYDWRGEFRYTNGLKMIYTDAVERTDENDGCLFTGDQGWVHVNRYGIWAEPESLLKVNLKAGDLHLHESNNHQEDFIRAVRTRGDTASNIEAGHKASYLGMIAETSVRLKRKLKWDPAREQFAGDMEANQLLTRPMRSPWYL